MRKGLQAIYNWIKNTGSFNVFLYALPVVIIVAVLYWIIRRTKQNKRLGDSFRSAIMMEKSLPNEIIRLLFVCWITVMICLTLLPTNFFGDFWHFAAYGGEWNPFPLSRWKWDYTPLLLDYLLHKFHISGSGIANDLSVLFMNIVLFIPLGLALPLILKEASLVGTVVFGFVCTTFIELIQPFMGGSGSIDDIICNTFGTYIGYMLFVLMKMFFPNFTDKCKFTPNVPKRYRI